MGPRGKKGVPGNGHPPFYLPRYSPHLNKAETHWRKAKYECLQPADYGSYRKFRKKIYRIFELVGLEYKVAFKELHPST